MTRTSVRVIVGVALLLSVAGVGYVVVNVDNAQDLVRVRNALIFDVAGDESFAWTPDSIPSDFHLERRSAPAELTSVVGRVTDTSSAGESMFARSLSIADHLVSADHRDAAPIQSDTMGTYKQIVANGHGYCADYTQAFNGLAHAGGIPVREWGMSFDRFSGDGHAFSEIYDVTIGKWMFVDSFYSFYVVDAAGIPMSVTEFHQSLSDDDSVDSATVVPIDASAFGFPDGERAKEYYRQGMRNLYLWMGNDVFSYDTHTLLRALASRSRSLQQLAAIGFGLHPRILILDQPSAEDGVILLGRLKLALWSAMLLPVLFLVAGICVASRLVRDWRRNRASSRTASASI